MRINVLACMSVVALVSSSCATMFQSRAELLKKRPGVGGEIAIHRGMDGDTNARMLAEGFMAETCGAKKPNIVEEGLVVVGQIKRAQGDSNVKQGYMGVSTSSTEETSEKREFRIQFECK